MSQDKQVKDFEAYYIENFQHEYGSNSELLEALEFENGEYVGIHAQEIWETWQAAIPCLNISTTTWISTSDCLPEVFPQHYNPDQSKPLFFRIKNTHKIFVGFLLKLDEDHPHMDPRGHDRPVDGYFFDADDGRFSTHATNVDFWMYVPEFPVKLQEGDHES